MEILLREVPNNYKYKKNYLDQNATEIETLILGNSQTLHGINPEYLDNAYNAAFAAQSLKYDYEILNKYKDKLTSLDNVIIPISYFSLFYELEDSKSSYLLKNYNLYLDIQKNNFLFNKYNFELTNIDHKTNIERIFDYYYLQKSPITINNYGWTGIFIENNEGRNFEETGKWRALRHNDDILKGIQNNYYIENVNYLEKIIKICEENEINLFAIIPPAHEEYRKYINEDYLNLSKNTLNNFAKYYSHFYYLNLFENNSFVRKDFQDPSHLNSEGAHKFTEMVKSFMIASKK